MKRINKQGFTLVEIMIVVAIIALLAAIAIPNLLRARITANEAFAKSTVRTLSTASETFGTTNNGDYPVDETADLYNATPKYINKLYCGKTISGFIYTCTMQQSEYTFVATPASTTSGTTTYTITTGGVFIP